MISARKCLRTPDWTQTRRWRSRTLTWPSRSGGRPGHGEHETSSCAAFICMINRAISHRGGERGSHCLDEQKRLILIPDYSVAFPVSSPSPWSLSLPLPLSDSPVFGWLHTGLHSINEYPLDHHYHSVQPSAADGCVVAPVVRFPSVTPTCCFIFL